jgi:hypothetical protein
MKVFKENKSINRNNNQSVVYNDNRNVDSNNVNNINETLSKNLNSNEDLLADSNKSKVIENATVSSITSDNNNKPVLVDKKNNVYKNIIISSITKNNNNNVLPINSNVIVNSNVNKSSNEINETSSPSTIENTHKSPPSRYAGGNVKKLAASLLFANINKVYSPSVKKNNVNEFVNSDTAPSSSENISSFIYVHDAPPNRKPPSRIKHQSASATSSSFPSVIPLKLSISLKK